MEWKNNLSLAEREETLTPSCTSRPRVACEKWNRVSICYKRRGPATNCAARPRPRVSSTPGCPSSWARPGSRRRRPRPGPPRRTTIGNPWQPAALAVAFYHRHPPPSGSWRWARATRDWSRGGGPSRGPPEPPLPPGGRNGGSRRPLGPRSPLPSRTRPSGPLSQPYERTERPRPRQPIRSRFQTFGSRFSLLFFVFLPSWVANFEWGSFRWVGCCSAPRGKHPFWRGPAGCRNDSDCDNLDPSRCSPAPNSTTLHWKVRGRSAASGVLDS